MFCVKFICEINMPANKSAINFIWVQSRKDMDVKFCKNLYFTGHLIHPTYFFFLCIHGIQAFLTASSAHPASQGGHSYCKTCCSELQTGGASWLSSVVQRTLCAAINSFPYVESLIPS